MTPSVKAEALDYLTGFRSLIDPSSAEYRLENVIELRVLQGDDADLKACANQYRGQNTTTGFARTARKNTSDWQIGYFLGGYGIMIETIFRGESDRNSAFPSRPSSASELAGVSRYTDNDDGVINEVNRFDICLDGDLTSEFRLYGRN